MPTHSQHDAGRGQGLEQKSSSAAMWSLLQNGSKEVLSVLAFLVLARFFLSKAEFGIVALATSFVLASEVLARFGLTSALIQRSEITDRHKNAAFWFTLAVGLLFAGAFVLSAPLLASMMEEPRLTPVLQVLSPGIVFTLLGSVQEALLRRELHFKELAKRALIATAVATTLGLAAASAGWGIWSLVVLNLTMSLVSTTLLWTYSTWRPRLVIPWPELRDLLPMGGNVTALGIVNYSTNFLDRILVGAVLGVASLGTYHVSKRIVNAIQTILTQSVNAVALPVFSTIQDDKARVRRGIVAAIRYMSAATFPSFAGIAVLSNEIVNVLLGEKWLEAAPIIALFSISYMIGSTTVFYQPVMIAVGRPRVALAMNILVAITFAGTILVGARWGLLGVGYATIATSLFTMAIWLAAARVCLDLDVGAPLRALRGTTLATGIMCVCVSGIRAALAGQAQILVLAVGVGLGVLVYVACLRLFDPMSFSLFQRQAHRLLARTQGAA